MQWLILSPLFKLCFVGAADCPLTWTLLRDELDPLDCSGTHAFLLVSYLVFMFQLLFTISWHSSLINQTLKTVNALALCLWMKEAFSWRYVWWYLMSMLDQGSFYVWWQVGKLWKHYCFHLCLQSSFFFRKPYSLFHCLLKTSSPYSQMQLFKSYFYHRPLLIDEGGDLTLYL